MKKDIVKRLEKKIEGKPCLSDEFHSQTNNTRIDSIDPKSIPRSWTKIHFKTYPRLDRFFLPKVWKTGSLSAILKHRRSIRQFNGYVSKEQLSYLLFYSCGLMAVGKTLDETRRPYPSAGARYPLEVYPLILNCKGIRPGLYHYNVKENSLESLLGEDLTIWLARNTGNEEWITKSAVVFIITGVVERTRVKYRDRGYRYILIEAGHLGQNIVLLATELKLGSCSIGGFIDNQFNRLLDIDKQKEVTLYLIAVGKPG